MKAKFFKIIFITFLLSFLMPSFHGKSYSAADTSMEKGLGESPQSVKKPKYDYMSTFLSRNTNPLGLKENIALKKYLNQPIIYWAVRSGKRHILN